MSYAIIRNIKYKLANLQAITRHHERLHYFSSPLVPLSMIFHGAIDII
jgi:hypothetical protein